MSLYVSARFCVEILPRDVPGSCISFFLSLFPSAFRFFWFVRDGAGSGGPDERTVFVELDRIGNIKQQFCLRRGIFKAGVSKFSFICMHN